MTSNIPANINPATAPAPQNRLGSDLIAMYLNRVEETGAGHFSISEQLAPAGPDRLALQHRRAELSSAFSKSDPREVVQRVARLFMRFPSTRLPDDVAKATMAAYAQDLAVFPLWAIDKACLAVIAGQADTSKAFAPSSVELRKACEKALEPARLEIADLNKILEAQTYRDPTPQEKAATHAKFRELVEELKLNIDPRDRTTKQQRAPTRSEAQAWVANAEANPKPWPAPSPALRKVLGLPDQEVSQMDQQEGRAA